MKRHQALIPTLILGIVLIGVGYYIIAELFPFGSGKDVELKSFCAEMAHRERVTIEELMHEATALGLETDKRKLRFLADQEAIRAERFEKRGKAVPAYFLAWSGNYFGYWCCYVELNGAKVSRQEEYWTDLGDCSWDLGNY